MRAVHPSTCIDQPEAAVPIESDACEGPLSTSFETIAYDHETDRKEAIYPAITGCDQLSFNPSLSAKPTTTNTDSASGLDVNLSVPQFVSALTPSPSEIKAATVTLPEGFSINPNAADGKTTCTRPGSELRDRGGSALPRDREGRDGERRELGAPGPDPRLTSTSANRGRAIATG